MLHAYDVVKCAVSVVKFARGSAELLAWGAGDGVVYVATAESPPRLLQVRQCWIQLRPSKLLA